MTTTATAIIEGLRNIHHVPMTREQLRQASDLLRHRFDVSTVTATRSFIPGDRVSFVGRNGRALDGIVEKVNIKSVGVKVASSIHQGGFQSWRVHSTLLSKVV